MLTWLQHKLGITTLRLELLACTARLSALEFLLEKQRAELEALRAAQPKPQPEPLAKPAAPKRLLEPWEQLVDWDRVAQPGTSGDA